MRVVVALGLAALATTGCDATNKCGETTPTCVEALPDDDGQRTHAAPDAGRDQVDAELGIQAASDSGLGSTYGSDASASAGPIPSSLVSFVPEDRSTNVRGDKLGLSVNSFASGRAPSEILAQLVTSLELVEWPSARVVPSASTVDAALPEYALHVSLKPAAALAEGWYALRLRPPPAGSVRLGFVGSELLEGIPTGRFRVGSKPEVLRIQLCPKGNAQTKVVVTFSEVMRATRPAASLLRLSGTSAMIPCSMHELAMADASELNALCEATPGATPLSVSLDGLESSTGIALADDAGAAPRYSLTPTALPELGGCRLFVPGRN